MTRRTVSIRPASGSNADRNRRALREMSDAQLMTGLTVEQLDAIQAEQRARVLARLQPAVTVADERRWASADDARGEDEAA